MLTIFILFVFYFTAITRFPYRTQYVNLSWGSYIGFSSAIFDDSISSGRLVTYDGTIVSENQGVDELKTLSNNTLR